MPASIATIEPGRGRVGDTVVVHGAGFGASGHNAVVIDSVTVPGADVVVIDSETLQVVAPAGIATGRHVVVQVTNGEDDTTATHWWRSKLSVAALVSDRIPGKQPGFREFTEGDAHLIEGKDFERAASKLELLPHDFLVAKGDLAPRASAGGLRRITVGADDLAFSRDAALGAKWRDRQQVTISWGKQVAAATVVEVGMVANGHGGSTGGDTQQGCGVFGKLSLLSIFVNTDSSGAWSRISRVRIAINGTVSFDSDTLGWLEQPYVRRGEVWTMAPHLDVSPGTRIQIGITKNNATDTLNVMASGTVQ